MPKSKKAEKIELLTDVQRSVLIEVYIDKLNLGASLAGAEMAAVELIAKSFNSLLDEAQRRLIMKAAQNNILASYGKQHGKVNRSKPVSALRKRPLRRV